MQVLLEGKGEEITLEGPLLGRGGEASLYAVPGRAHLAAKIYHNPTAEHANKLAAMLAAPPVPPPAGTEHVDIAWPIARLLEADGPGPRMANWRAALPNLGVVGYLMPRIDRARLIWEFYNPGTRQQTCPEFHYGLLLRTAGNLARVVQDLHEGGYVIGDLNESNVLVTPQGQVTLVDVDSIQVPAADRLYRCTVGRPDYTPPELQGAVFAEVDRRPEQDAFALAVLIFQLLMQGTHPFAGVCSKAGEPDAIPVRITAGAWPYAWERSVSLQPSPHAPSWFVLPPAVQDLFTRCFEEGHTDPERRPRAADWRQALEEAETNLATCAANSHHVYQRGLDTCPWCVQARQCGRDPFPTTAAAQARARSREQNVSVRLTRAAPARQVTVLPLREDPRPPRPEPEPLMAIVLGPPPGVVETGLQGVGAVVERRSWIAWVGMALVGTVAGLLWALEHAPVPMEREKAPAALAQSPVPEPPAETATPPPVVLTAKEKQEAEKELQEAAAVYQRAVRAYMDALNGYRKGQVTQQELTSRQRAMQDELLRYQDKKLALSASTAKP
jgi:DNA-binding helix-hairpin-helix protein with protein kinase domain